MDPSGIIVACASPPAASLRGVIRASGEGALRLLDASTEPSASGPGGGIRTLRLPGLRLPCVALAHPAPRSFTGQESFELLLPGNPRLLAMVEDALLQAAEGAGVHARRAEAGEFTARAFHNGRLTLEAAEGVEAVIRAADDAALQAARRLLDGTAGAEVDAWSGRVAELLALVEAGIDFTDEEDVVAVAPARAAAACRAVAADIRGALDARRGRAAAAQLPVVLLVGEANAGKSTLFNALLGRVRTLAAPTAGTTRDAIRERVTLAAGVDAILVDLPGAGRHDPEAAAIVSAAAEGADLLLLCMSADARDAGMETGSSAGRGAAVPGHATVDADLPRLLVRTKSDLAAARPGEDAVRVCAPRGEGLQALRRAMEERLQRRAAASEGARHVLPRHAAALSAAASALEAAVRHAQTERSEGPWSAPELMASHLREALHHLGQIRGATTPDDVLALVFGRFCIGK